MNEGAAQAYTTKALLVRVRMELVARHTVAPALHAHSAPPGCGRVGSTLSRCLLLLLLSVRFLLVVWNAVPVAAIPAADVDADP